jgi:hypothetical protein
MAIATERVGARVYVTGNTYEIRGQLKNAGCHWDGDRKAWWIGAAKASELESLIAGLGSAPAAAQSSEQREDVSGRPVYGKVEYKGRAYYVIGISQRTGKLWLTVLDGSINFWAAETACRWTKTYEPREYRGRREHQTLGGLRRFIERSREADREIAAGRIPHGYAIDREDGQVKRRSECDMPE